MRTEQNDARIRLFEAFVYLVATVATIYLTVEEWRIRQAIAEIRSAVGFMPEEPSPEPSPAEVSRVHDAARRIIRDAVSERGEPDR